MRQGRNLAPTYSVARVAVICRPARLEGLCRSFLATRTVCSLHAFASLLGSFEGCLTLFARRILVEGMGREETHQTEKKGDSNQLDFLHSVTRVNS